jgi:hypothetical protein
MLKNMRNNFTKLLSFIGAIMILSACSNITTKDYANKTPKLDIREYLNGDLEAEGVLIDYTGKADLSFYATLKGSWKGNEGKLEEEFFFSDGKKQNRTWIINVSDDNNFTATAGDVVGTAKGSQNGNAVNMKYVLQVPYNGSTINMSMDDWMYLIDAGQGKKPIIINRTAMKKFGIKLGELQLVIRKK